MLKEFIARLSKLTKVLFIIGINFVCYGNIARLGNIYFFWESKTIGWIVLLFGLISLFADRIKLKKAEKRNSIGEKVGMGFVIFILVVQAVLYIVLPFSNAYAAAKLFLAGNENIKAELGEVRGFGLMATGAIQIQTSSAGESGAATINLIVKGEKAYRDVTLYLAKYPNKADWVVEEME
jgi:hypothetical protein